MADEQLLKVVVACALVAAQSSADAAAVACCEGGAGVVRGGWCGKPPPAPRIALNCSNGYMLLRDIVLDGDKLYTQDTPDFLFSQDPNEYCVGSMLRNATAPALGQMAVAVLCYELPPSGAGSGMEVSGALTLLSAIFLLATVVVYCYLPQLRDLQGQCYVCVCVSMAAGFLALGSLQLSAGFRGAACAFTGFSIYFWMMATFFWMNVICFNMSSVVIGWRWPCPPRALFLRYCAYAWGGPLLLLLCALATNYAESATFRPGIDDTQCWIQGRAETWVFFYGPIAALLAVNVALFVGSALALWQHTHKYEMDRLGALRHRFLLCLKLFLVMGISWVFEVASFAHGESHIVWVIMDTFNCLQGVVIFILLVVVRRRAVRGLARAGCLPRRLAALVDRLGHPDPDSAEPVLSKTEQAGAAGDGGDDGGMLEDSAALETAFRSPFGPKT